MSGGASAVRSFIDLKDYPTAVLRAVLDEGHQRKRARPQGAGAGEADADSPAQGRIAALFFEKPSTRTRLSFDVALKQLGAQSIILRQDELQWSRGETQSDTARILSGYVDAVVARVDHHETLEKLQERSSIPIINALSSRSHPCQIMGDMLTLEEHCGALEKISVAWVGDGNNVAVSLIEAAVHFGFRLRLACPADSEETFRGAIAHAADMGVNIEQVDAPLEAVRGAHCVMTDTWNSMSYGDDKKNRKGHALRYYQVTDEVMEAARDDAIFMHCLPAYRGQEVAATVIDGKQSRVFEQAVNRLHIQKAILLWCWDLIGPEA